MGTLRYDNTIFCQTESVNLDDFIVATYIMKARTTDPLMRAGALAVEQTTGTWVRVPDETDEVREGHVGRVIAVYNVPGYETSCPDEVRTFIIKIAFPWVNFGPQMPEMLGTIFGNISMSENLKLIDMEFPKKFTDQFAGPQFGVEGLRKLVNVYDRPLVLAMIKPCTGITVDVVERQFYQLAMAGIDFIKDDELNADPVYCPFYERLEACLRASDRAYRDSGHRAIYFPNITDRQDKIFEKAKRAVEMGAPGLMLNSHAAGYGVLGALAEDKSLNVPLLSHPCYAGSAYAGSETGLSSSLVFGKFMRLEGADIVVYPCAYGKVPALPDRYIRSAQGMLRPFNGMKNTMPSPSAGMHPGMVPHMMSDLGEDVILGAGAAMHAHPMGLKAGVDALHQAAEAWKEDIPLEKYAETHPELKAAIDIWGVYDPKESIFELTK